MKEKWSNLLYLIYPLIPIVTVSISRLLRLAQGEKNEEIVIGVFIGVIIDLLLAIVHAFIRQKNC